MSCFSASILKDTILNMEAHKKGCLLSEKYRVSPAQVKHVIVMLLQIPCSGSFASGRIHT